MTFLKLFIISKHLLMHLNVLIQRFMFEYELNSKIIAVDSVSQAVENATVCILAIPTQMVNNTICTTLFFLIISTYYYFMHCN